MVQEAATEAKKKKAAKEAADAMSGEGTPSASIHPPHIHSTVIPPVEKEPARKKRGLSFSDRMGIAMRAGAPKITSAAKTVGKATVKTTKFVGKTGLAFGEGLVDEGRKVDYSEAARRSGRAVRSGFSDMSRIGVDPNYASGHWLGDSRQTTQEPRIEFSRATSGQWLGDASWLGYQRPPPSNLNNWEQDKFIELVKETYPDYAMKVQDRVVRSGWEPHKKYFIGYIRSTNPEIYNKLYRSTKEAEQRAGFEGDLFGPPIEFTDKPK